MRNYEIMLILPPEADDEVVNGAVDRIAKVIGPSGGEVGNVDRWGRRRMAYEIAKQKEGYYVVVGATADPSTIKELDRVLSLADEVIRFKALVRAA